MEKIKELLAEILSENTPVSADEIDENASLLDEVGLDSLQLINFILRVEDEFDIEIDFENLDQDRLASVKAFADFVKSCKGAKV